MNHQKLFRWAKNHFFGLLVSFVVFCTLLGLRAGLGLAMEDDAPGAIFIFGGIAFVGSSIVALIWAGIGKMLMDREEK